MLELTVSPKKLAVPNTEGSHTGRNLKIMSILLQTQNLNYRKEKSSSLSGFCLPRRWEETAPPPKKIIRYLPFLIYPDVTLKVGEK